MRAAIYCRLSEEDRNKSSSYDESESIQNQKSILLNYAIEKGWDVYKIFCDEDFSGADSERPEFCQMIRDAEAGKFDTVLCKTQSRFTRDMELVEKYLHGKFLEWGVRFVSVLDNADTNDKTNKKSRQINGLINEWYLEDISDNIKMVFKNKHREGKCTRSFLPYGYSRDPRDKNGIIVDPVAANVVRDIFAMYVGGTASSKICRKLNDKGILPPLKYKEQMGQRLCTPCEGNHSFWNQGAICRIIRNQMYVGDLVHNVYRKVSYKSKKVVMNPKSEWTVVPNTHEAIIDRDTFELAQGLMNGRIKPMQNGEAHIFAKKLRCMDCGSALHKTGSKYKDREYAYFRCRLWMNGFCTSHRISYYDLKDIIEARIRGLLQSSCDDALADRIPDVSHNQDRFDVINTELSAIEGEISKQKDYLKQIYVDKVNGLINDDEFVDLKNSFNASQELAKRRRESLVKERDMLLEKKDEKVNKPALLGKYINFEELDRRMVDDFIEVIEVGEVKDGEQAIKIHWKV